VRVLTWIEWIGLVLVVVSGATWLVLRAAQMADAAWQEVLSEGLVPTVLLSTDFGHDWIARAVLAGLLVATLIGARPARRKSEDERLCLSLPYRL
jgi:putative copper resistance protein D